MLVCAMLSVLVLVCALANARAAYEGDFCDANGVEGVCTNLQQCPAAIRDIRDRVRPPPQMCGFQNSDVIVCCQRAAPTTGRPVLTTTRRSATTTTEYVPPEYTYVDITDNKAGGELCEPIPPIMSAARTGQKAWDKCIEYQERFVFPCERGMALSGEYGRVNHCHHNADELIIGGTAAASLEFPHMVLLGYQNDAGVIKWQCGGALISERFVLTAGHCIADKESFDVSHAMVGALRRSEVSDANRYGVRRVIPHPQYRAPGKYHDIALLELDRAVPLDHRTVPACLHVGNGTVDESRASATGWGSTVYNKASDSDVLQKVILTKFPAGECGLTYTANRHMADGVDDRTQICYGDRTKSKDTCQGDSGGPLQAKNKRIACMYTVLGVTSFGQACGWAGVPGIYTRVERYLPWIESVVWP